jgi:hypothetical protein
LTWSLVRRMGFTTLLLLTTIALVLTLPLNVPALAQEEDLKVVKQKYESLTKEQVVKVGY